jgi:hypothetical protein
MLRANQVLGEVTAAAACSCLVDERYVLLPTERPHTNKTAITLQPPSKYFPRLYGQASDDFRRSAYTSRGCTCADQLILHLRSYLSCLE